MTPTYLETAKRVAGPSGGAPIQLVRECREGSLCGLLTASLSNVGIFDVLVCAACIEWVPKRIDFTDAHHPNVTAARKAAS